MRILRIPENAIVNWVDKLIAQQRVIGVQAKDDHFVYDELHSARDLRLDHDVTILPPVRYFMPQKEDIVKFSSQGKYESLKPNDGPFVLIGVHPYDLVAIRQLDTVFASGQRDPHYLDRRRRATIVACDVETPSKNVFAGHMGTATVEDGFDILLTRIGSEYVVEVATDKGEAIASFLGDATQATSADLEQRQKVWEHNRNALRKHNLQCRPEDLPALLAASYNDDFWRERSEHCFSCGSCNLVCPTCYCFDIQDVTDWDLKSGHRVRLCDSCMLSGFSKVAGGHQFRQRMERYRHRFFRKALYMPQRFGFVACTGCGRCISACVADIANPVDVYNALAERHPEALTVHDESGETTSNPIETRAKFEKLMRQITEEDDLGRRRVPQGAAPAVAPDKELPRLAPSTAAKPSEKPNIHLIEMTDPYLPEMATIVASHPMTANETYYEIKLDSGRPLGHQPGQFVEISLMGVGEAPISISSAASTKGTFEMVVRRAGNLTEALSRLKPGDKLGVRGPFGTSFPMQRMKGKDILIAAGGLGIVPVRSAIQHVLAHLEDYGRLMIAYGMRAPADQLFGEEIAAWRELPDVSVLETVDRLEGSWEGRVGPVTTLLPHLSFDPKTTVAIVCGPPVMYRYVLSDLMNLGMSPDDIYVSLERRMKCGVGKCGHCQIDGIYVCQEGPVFTYKQIMNVQEAL